MDDRRRPLILTDGAVGAKARRGHSPAPTVGAGDGRHRPGSVRRLGACPLAPSCPRSGVRRRPPGHPTPAWSATSPVARLFRRVRPRSRVSHPASLMRRGLQTGDCPLRTGCPAPPRHSSVLGAVGAPVERAPSGGLRQGKQNAQRGPRGMMIRPCSRSVRQEERSAWRAAAGRGQLLLHDVA